MSSSLLPAAARRIRLKTIASLLLGNAILAFCGYAWLLIPDSHAWELLLAVLLGVLLVAAFFWLQAKALRSVREPIDPLPLRVGAPMLAGWAVILHVLLHPAAQLSYSSFSERAGYWNSKLSPHWRTIFTYSRLYDWQRDIVSFIFGFVLPALLLPFLVETICRRPSRDTWTNGLQCLRRWQYWLTAAIVFWVVNWLTARLIDWMPGKSVSAEIASVLLRLATLYLLDTLLIVGLFAIIAELLARHGTASNDVAGDATL